MKKFFVFIIISFMLQSCFKTAEQIRREKQVDHQLAQSSRIIADLNIKIEELQGRLAQATGQIEEIDHKATKSNQEQKMSFSETLAQLQEQVRILSEENQKNKTQIAELNEQVSSQKKYIKKVNSTLTGINKKSTSTSQSTLKKAHKAFDKKQRKTAKKLYLQVLSEGKINNAVKNHVYYNLGLIEYYYGKYDDALAYFSKIYTKYPRSSYAPKSLLYIGRSFKKSKRKDEATATFEELIKNYPKSKQAAEAKKELK